MIPPAHEGRRPVRGRLVAAREAKGLDRAAAAKLAKVPLRFAEMLEEGKYSLVADPAYLVPYLRRYAAALDISADALVIAFHQENELADRMAPLPNVLEMPVGPSHRRRLQRLATVAAFLGGVVVTFAALSVPFGNFDLSLEGWDVSIDGWMARLSFGRKLDAAAAPEDTVEPLARVVAPTASAERAAPEPVAAAPTAIRIAPTAVPVVVAPTAAPIAIAATPRRVVAAATAMPTVVPAATAFVARVAPTVPPTPQAVAAATPLALARAGETRVPSRPAIVPTVAPRSSYRLELTGTARQVWVWISVDGGRRRAVEIRRGDSVRFDAAQSFLLSLDDAGGVEAKLNGRALPPLGSPGEARRNVRFPDG